MRPSALVLAFTLVACNGDSTDADSTDAVDTDGGAQVDHGDDDDDDDDDDNSDDSTDDPSTDGFDPDTEAVAYAEAFCAWRAACEPIFADFIPQTLSQCEAAITEEILVGWRAVAPLVDDGVVSFRPSELAACIADFEAAQDDCEVGRTPDACSHIFGGTAVEGAACSATDECKADLWCNAGVAECGTCEPRAGVGDDCSATPCVDDLACAQVSSTDFMCLQSTAHEHDACGTLESGLCRGQLQCVGDASWTCERPAAAQDACDTTGVAPDCNLLAGQTCAEGFCSAVEVVGPTEACGPTAPTHLCGAGSFCGASELCVPNITADHQCSAAKPCEDGLYCKKASPGATTGTCKPALTTGTECTDSAQCEGYLYCIEGFCDDLEYDATCQ